MNGRIKELAEQAWPLGQMMTDDTDQFNTRIEKFAELIVRECSAVARECENANYSGAAIEEHFGLKEQV